MTFGLVLSYSLVQFPNDIYSTMKTCCLLAKKCSSTETVLSSSIDPSNGFSYNLTFHFCVFCDFLTETVFPGSGRPTANPNPSEWQPACYMQECGPALPAAWYVTGLRLPHYCCHDVALFGYRECISSLSLLHPGSVISGCKFQEETLSLMQYRKRVSQ